MIVDGRCWGQDWTHLQDLMPTEDRGRGVEGVFLVILVGTIYMRVVVVSSVSVAGRPCADLITDLAVLTL